MRMKTARTIAGILALTILVACSPSGDGSQPVAAADPLPSWNDGDAKQQILDFVARVTDPASPDFVPEAERIATFDNDGTLWAEQPLYFQLLLCHRSGQGAGSGASRVGRLSSRSRPCSRANEEALAASGRARI